MKKSLFTTGSLIPIITIIFGIHIVYSQTLSREIITTTGDYFTSPTASLSWTLGEPIIETFADINNILTQGFQQSDDIIISIKENYSATADISVYPVPATTQITIQWKLQEKKIKIELYDALGKLLINEDVECMPGELNKKVINMSNYPFAHYLLRISTPNYDKVKTFKITKHTSKQ